MIKLTKKQREIWQFGKFISEHTSVLTKKQIEKCQKAADATHDIWKEIPLEDDEMPCATCVKGKAVFDQNLGVFLPCQECQEKGWSLCSVGTDAPKSEAIRRIRKGLAACKCWAPEEDALLPKAVFKAINDANMRAEYRETQMTIEGAKQALKHLIWHIEDGEGK